MPGPSAYDVIKPQVRSISAYTLKHFEAEVKLDQNENPYELPAEVKREIVSRVLERPWGRYPEFIPKTVLAVLSKFTGWPEEGILVGNGSNELIEAALIVTLGAGSRMAIPQPTFTLYKLLATMLGAAVDEIYLNDQDLSFNVDRLAEAAHEVDVTALCSPNNPTGNLLSHDDLRRIVRNARGLVLLDEAYHEFSEQTAMPLLRDFNNLVILRTFSKAMTMAGLRFGYMMGHPKIIREIYKAKLPYNINIFTLTAAEMAVEKRHVLDNAIRSIIRERDRVLVELARRPSVRVFSSKANFVLIKTPYPSQTVFEALYSEGVLVRDVSKYPLLDRALRVSIGRPEENNRFLRGLDRALEKGQ